MLTISKRPTFRRTVEVKHEAMSGSFECTFEALPQDEIDRLESQGRANGKGPRALLRRVVCVAGAIAIGDTEVSYSGEPSDPGLDTMLQWAPVASAMARAYYQGLWDADSGN